VVPFQVQVSPSGESLALRPPNSTTWLSAVSSAIATSLDGGGDAAGVSLFQLKAEGTGAAEAVAATNIMLMPDTSPTAAATAVSLNARLFRCPTCCPMDVYLRFGSLP
jgi:hypothetical protein